MSQKYWTDPLSDEVCGDRAEGLTPDCAVPTQVLGTY
jgi:hypothetical protein